MNRLISRTAFTSIIAAAIAAGPFETSKAQVGLAIKGLSLAGTILGLGGRGNSVDSEAIMATMRMVAELGNRLTGVEDTLKIIMKKIDAFPEQVQTALREDADIRRIEESKSAVFLLKDYMAALPEKRKKEELATEERLQSIRSLFTEFQLRREALFQRSDFVVPEIVASLATEVAVNDRLSPPPYSTTVILREYYNRLAEVESLDRPGSLASLTQDLEKVRQAKELEIAAFITKKSSHILSEGTYLWYSHTKVHPEERVTYFEIPPLKGADGPIDRSGSRRETIQVPDHTRALSWVVSKEPVQDENGAGLYHIKLDTATAETKGGNRSVEPHTEADDVYEKSHHQVELKNSQAMIEDYNGIVDAITSVRRLQAIAAAGRTLIFKWNVEGAQKLASSITQSDFHAQSKVNEISKRQQQEETRAMNENIDERRERFVEVTDEGYRRVREAAEKARKEKWHSDFQTYVGLLSQSYDFYNSAKAELSDNKDATKSSSASGSQSRGGAPSLAITARRIQEPNRGVRTDRIDQTPKWSLAEKPLVLERHLWAELADVAQHPASSWAQVPKQLTLQEVEAMEVEQTIRSLPQTQADREATTSQDQVLEVEKDAAKGFAKGGPIGAAKAIEDDLRNEVHLGDDGPLGAESRSLLENEARQRMQEFFDARFGKAGPIIADPSTVCLGNPDCQAGIRTPTP
jgi:hypothetical protein